MSEPIFKAEHSFIGSQPWNPLGYSFTVPACRTGWLGVWDALVAAVTGNKRMIVLTPLEVSCAVRLSKPEPTTISATICAKEL